MQRYDTYKPSGVKWLGEIPSHWEVKRLASYFTERRVKVSDKDYEPLSVTKLGIFPQWENVAKTNDGDNRKLVKKGDFVINSRSDRKGSSGVSDRDGSVSLINIVLQPRKTILAQYSNYLLKSYRFIEEYYRNGRGIVADLWTTRYDEMKMIKLAIPPLKEQEAIANYLDAATAKIDAAIAQQQKMIDLLNERKQIIINRAVTKGLNPNAKMKDSGVEWIGEVPEGWEIVTLKRLAGGFSNGTSLSQLSNGETPYRVSRIETISSGRINYDKTGFVKYDSTLPKYKMALNDILISNINSFERIGNSAIYNGEESLYHGMNLLRIKPNTDVVPQYLITYLKSSLFSLQMKLACKPAVNQVSVPSSSVKNMLVVLPSISEQHKLVEYCFSKIEEIEVAIKGANKQISLFQERKQIIINEVVTGKVKVG